MNTKNIVALSGLDALKKIIKKHKLRIEIITTRDEILRTSTKKFSAPIFLTKEEKVYNK